ncbi:MAG: protein kinase [Lentisphaeraceae bacterium]|nr:protein kinase [Lentisphaeraceae bacterium]
MDKSNHSSSVEQHTFHISKNLLKKYTEKSAEISAEEIHLKETSEDRYRLQEQIGQGGMGKILVVEDSNLNRILAMKILDPKNSTNPRLGEAFIEEAQITGQLQHPNIIPIHDIGILPDNGKQYYTMKLVEGESLQEIIDALKLQDPAYQRTYTMHALLTIFRKVCDALAYAHSIGIIHRDIKPANIMVGKFGEVLVLDWGLAKYKSTEGINEVNVVDEDTVELESGHISSSLMTMAGTIKGSLAYISPEQAMADNESIDHQSDIFLLGATLYHMLTLQPPYSGRDIVDVITKAEDAQFTHPNDTEHGSLIPEALVNILMKSMTVDKKERFQSVADLIEKIDDYLEARNVSEMRYYKVGEILIEDEDLGDDTYILVDGAVEVICNIDGKLTVLDTLSKGAVFGELAPLTHDVRSATIKATEKCCVMVISKQLMFDEIRKLPPWLEKIIFTLASKVSSMSDRIHPFILSNCCLPVLKQLLYIFSMVNINPEGEKTVAVERRGIIHEISENLGLSSGRIEEVLLLLEEFDMAESDSMGRLAIFCLKDLAQLITYVKREEHITEGIAQSFEEIDIQKIPFLDKVYKKMAALQY